LALAMKLLASVYHPQFHSFRFIRKVFEKIDGNNVTVSAEILKSDESNFTRQFPSHQDGCSLCRLGLELSFMDVLILRQFMRNDGTVLPQQLTKLCTKQQRIVERLVMQAHLSGLFPTLKPRDYDFKTESEGYKAFNRYWRHHADLYSRKLTVIPGSFYYIKR
ncbi:28S ribosomal protein S18a, mitochondrial, partial [Trichinella britovi]